MKTTATLLKMKSFGFLAIFSLALSACGSYSGVSYYANDGVYSTPRKTVYEVPVNSTISQKNSSADQNTQNPNEFGSYFSERANTYADLLTDEVITSADQYVGSGDMTQTQGSDKYTSQPQASWGSSPSQVSIQIHNNPWFDQFYAGNPNMFLGQMDFYYNSIPPMNRGWMNFYVPSWRRNNWGWGFYDWNYDPWGWNFNGWGNNNWGLGFNNWGWGANRWNNWGWGGRFFNNPSIFYGPYNYNRVQRYTRNNRFNSRSPYRTSYAINASRRGKTNVSRKRTTAYTLRKNSLNVNGLRNYLRNTNNGSLADTYRSGANQNIRNNGIDGVNRQNSRNNLNTNSRVSRSATSYRSNSIRNNSQIRTPRATRSQAVMRSRQAVGTQIYRNLSPAGTRNYRAANTRSINGNSSMSPIRRTPTNINNSARSYNNGVNNTNYRRSSNNNRNSVNKSSGAVRSSSVRSSNSRSSNRSSSSRSSSRSSGRNNQ